MSVRRLAAAALLALQVTLSLLGSGGLHLLSGEHHGCRDGACVTPATRTARDASYRGCRCSHSHHAPSAVHETATTGMIARSESGPTESNEVPRESPGRCWLCELWASLAPCVDLPVADDLVAAVTGRVVIFAGQMVPQRATLASLIRGPPAAV